MAGEGSPEGKDDLFGDVGVVRHPCQVLDLRVSCVQYMQPLRDRGAVDAHAHPDTDRQPTDGQGTAAGT